MRKEKEQTIIFDKEIISSILAKVDGRPRAKIISFQRLFGKLNSKEKEFVKKFLMIDPRRHGFKGASLGMTRIPVNLVVLKKQIYALRRGRVAVDEQYVPRPVFDAYRKLNQALKKETGKKLLIGSGYRSPAYQVIIFFRYLKFYGFDFSKTIKRVALPEYSEHCMPQRQALDFLTTEGIPTDERPFDFEETKEYCWLRKNAQQFGFFLSYPRGNRDGMAYEPWHWRFEKHSPN